MSPLDDEGNAMADADASLDHAAEAAVAALAPRALQAIAALGIDSLDARVRGGSQRLEFFFWPTPNNSGNVIGGFMTFAEPIISRLFERLRQTFAATWALRGARADDALAAVFEREQAGVGGWCGAQRKWLSWGLDNAGGLGPVSKIAGVESQNVAMSAHLLAEIAQDPAAAGARLAPEAAKWIMGRGISILGPYIRGTRRVDGLLIDPSVDLLSVPYTLPARR